MRKSLVPVAVACALFAQCSTPRQGPLRVEYVLKTLDASYWVTMRDAVLKEAARQAMSVTVVAPPRTTDTDRQIALVEAAIERKVDAIVVAPVDSRALVGAVLHANGAGIPVVVVDTKLDEDELTRQGARTSGFVGSDNFLGGQLEGMALVDATGGRGTVAVLEGPHEQETARSRNEGMLKGLGAAPGIEVVASEPADFERDKGEAVADAILAAHPGIRGIVAANDEMALGAVRALRRRHFSPGQVKVVGFDGTAEAVAAVKDGWMSATVAQQPDRMGVIALEMVRNAADGDADGTPRTVHTLLQLVTRASAGFSQ